MTPQRRLEAVLLPAAAAAALVALWGIAVRWSGTNVFPSPAAVARGIAELARKGLLLRYTRDSLRRVGAGYGLALAVGIPLGVFLGWRPTAARAANPVIQFLRPISPPQDKSSVAKGPCRPT